METAEYWPMAWEYGIWNTAIASLQFWAEDLNPVTLGITLNVSTTISSGLQPATPYASYLKKLYLYVLFLH